MLDLRPLPYRVLLLTSVAGVALTGIARAQTGPIITITSGSSVTNTGAITASSGQTVRVLAGASAFNNSGLVQATGANGIGIQVVSSGAVGSITNSGTVVATNGGQAILVGDTAGAAATVNALTNSGLVQVVGGGQAIYIEPGSSIAAIINSGTIAMIGAVAAGSANALQDAINVAGTAGQISNSGLIQGGAAGAGIRVEGAVGSINNASGGTIGALGDGNAIAVVGSAGSIATIGLLSNSGLIQSPGTNAAILVNNAGSVGSISNNSGGVIQATGGAAAIATAGTIGGISNSGTIQTTNGGAAIAANAAGASIGSVSNSGLLQSSGTNSAISVASGASITTIVNSAGGTILPGGSGGFAINDAGSIGSISNSGLIQQAIPNDVAVYVTGTAGSITNNLGGVIQATGSSAADIRVTGSVTSITNAGTLLAAGSAGTGNGDAAVRVDGTVGAISNSGLMQVGNGPVIYDYAGSIGTINNTGTAQAVSSGNAILIGDSAVATVGSIVNTGLLQSAGTHSAVSVQSLGTLGSIANNLGGTLLASGTGNGLFAGGTVGAVSNAGSILAPQGTGVLIGVGSSGTAAGRIVNGITNTASGLIQGGPGDGSGVAIDDSGGTAGALTINNAGSIVGAIKLGPNADTLNVTGGSITGAITGTGTGDTLNFAIGNTGSFATGGPIAGVSNINLTSGVVNFQTSVATALAFTIGSGGTAVLNPSAPIGAASFNNAGVVDVGSGRASITGNYTQASTGTLRITIGNGASGQLNVSGNAGILGATNAVSAHVPLNAAINPLIGQTETVLTAGTLAVSNAGSLTASSDSVSLAFTLAQLGDSLVLTNHTPNSTQALTAAARQISNTFAPVNALLPPTSNDLAAQNLLADVLAGLGASGNGQLAQTLLSVITSLTPTQLVQLEKQLVPSSVASTNFNFLGASGMFTTGEDNIDTQLAALQSQDTGLAAGDEVGRGIRAWVLPFGSFLNQDARDGFDGYSLSNYGATLGGDELILPNLRVGIAVTLSNQDVRFSGFTSGSTASTFSAQFGLYGVYYIDNFFVNGLLSFGYNHFTSQTPFVAGIASPRDADFGGTELSARLGVGYDFKLANGMVLTPMASVQQIHVNYNSYTTNGGFPFNLHVNGESADITQTRLGGRLTYPIKLSFGTLTPELHFQWFHDFGRNELVSSYTMSDVAGGGAFALVGPPSDRDTYDVGIGVTVARSGPWSFGAGYDFLGRATSRQHVFFLMAKYEF